jgi:putative FmdB family regulatory protein
MPIYEYRCQNCGHDLEALQKISDEPLQKCPECGEPELKKRVSAAAFRLKGGGWYETDFKTGDKKNLAGASDKAPSGDASSGGGASTSGSDTKKSA